MNIDFLPCKSRVWTATIATTCALEGQVDMILRFVLRAAATVRPAENLCGLKVKGEVIKSFYLTVSALRGILYVFLLLLLLFQKPETSNSSHVGLWDWSKDRTEGKTRTIKQHCPLVRVPCHLIFIKRSKAKENRPAKTVLITSATGNLHLFIL